MNQNHHSNPPTANQGARRSRRSNPNPEGSVGPISAFVSNPPMNRRERRAPIASAALIICCGLILFSPLSRAATSAPGTNAPAPNDISAFNLITERNIFNTRRSARYVPSERRESRRAPRTEAFALVGTLAYEKGPFAFFDGSRSDFKEVARQGDSIAGFKVAEIAPSHVKLTSATNEFELRLGMQLHREDGGTWQLSVRPESAEPAVAPSATSHLSFQTNSAPTNPAGISELLNGLANGIANGEIPNFGPQGGDPSFGGQPLNQSLSTNAVPVAPSGGSENDVLLRLMQRRLQENNQ